MANNKGLVRDRGGGGRFIDVDLLLPLFTELTLNASHHWREAFGLLSSHQRHRDKLNVTVRVQQPFAPEGRSNRTPVPHSPVPVPRRSH